MPSESPRTYTGRAAATAREPSDLLVSVSDSASGIIVAVLEPEGALRIIWANPAFAAVVGGDPRNLIGRRFDALLGAFPDRELSSRLIAALHVHERVTESTVLYNQRLKSSVIVEIVATRLMDRSHSSEPHVAIAYRQQTAALVPSTIEHDHDALTDLPRRDAIIAHIDTILVPTPPDAARRATVLSIGVDGFGLVNENLGHHAGDAVLHAVASRIALVAPAGAMLARLDGDEFALAFEPMLADGERLAHDITELFTKPFAVGGTEIYLTVSIGIATALNGFAGSAEDVVRNANIAMCRAKKMGRGCSTLFQDHFRDESKRRMRLQNDLRQAIDRRELRVFYQPIVTLSTNTLRGVEALLRWEHPDLGMISPDEFVPIAEESGNIVRIGTWVLNEACRQVKEWQTRFPSANPLGVSVNVSAKQLDASFGSVVMQALRTTALDPRCLHVEITESVFMSDALCVTRAFEEIRAAGVEIHIDDFGTGYSSLSYLKRFAVDVLKIDKSFVSGKALQPSLGLTDPEIVKTIIDLAGQLGLSVIAEGVETRRQADELEALRCTHTQGYLYSQALCAEAVPDFLTLTSLGGYHSTPKGGSQPFVAPIVIPRSRKNGT